MAPCMSFHFKNLWEAWKPVLIMKGILAITICALCLPQVLQAQRVQTNAQPEQSEFGIDDPDQVQRPVELTRAALDALSTDKRVASCLEHNDMNPEDLPANWFIASEIHLGGADEEDLVVLPHVPLPEPHAGKISPNACLIGAKTAQMWVLRSTETGFQLVLSQLGLGMEVLSTRTNGFRDIQVGLAVAGYDDEFDYKFDGTSYQIAGRTSTFYAGEAKVPSSLSGFETRRPLIQRRGKSSEAVRAKARAWIWRHWEMHKRAYIKVETHDEAADETASYYLAPDEKGEWEVTIDIHRIVRTDAATSSFRSISEKDLYIAETVQRVEPTSAERYPPVVIPESESVPESKYKLQFLDYRGIAIAEL
jgi:hypothetical protein